MRISLKFVLFIIIFVLENNILFVSPPTRSEHVIVHVPYKVHTVHHHHTEKVHVPVHIIKHVPVIKHIPIYKEVHVPVIKEVHVPIHVPEYKGWSSHTVHDDHHQPQWW